MSTPQTLGNYRLLHQLGRGTSGVVFAAQQADLPRPVALKVLDLRGTDVEVRHARFEREARLLAELAHPHVVRVLDAGVAEGVPWLAMELVEGGSLAAALASLRAQPQPQPPRTAADLWRVVPGVESAAVQRDSTASYQSAILRLFVALADALAFAHAAGVVHRDVKPANILLHRDGRALLADFGLARVEHDGGASEATPRGTPAYMAPEQARGERGDARSDQFALAATLFEALTLTPPFLAANAVALALRVQTEDAPDVRRFAPTLSADLAAVLRRALARDPQARYASLGALRADLVAVLEDRATAARPPGPLRRLWSWTVRRPWRAAAALCAMAAAAALFGYDRLHRHRLEHERSRATAALQRRDRLALGVRLARAEAEAQELRGITVAEADAIERWLEQTVAPLRAGLVELERELATLRQLALPYREADRDADRTRIGCDAPMRQAAGELALREQQHGDAALAPSAREQAGARLAALRQAHRELEERLAADRSWRFAADEDQFLHDQLHDLALRLQAFCGQPSAPTERLRARCALTRRNHQRTVIAGAARWAEVARDLAADARFAGVTVVPRADLLPLRRDPQSSLWEFVHLPSGQADGDVPDMQQDGRYALRPESGAVLVLLPGGTFTMGAQKERPDAANFDPEAKGNEAPVRTIELAPFYCGKHELTEPQLQRLAGSAERVRDPRQDRTSTKPLEPATWVSYARALPVLREVGVRLLTEAQWEYACRAGESGPFSFGARSAAGGFANIADEAWRRAGARGQIEAGIDDGFGWLAPIGSLRPNAFGLHDMYGNAVEMVDDLFGDYRRPARAADARSSSRLGYEHVIFRGGNFAQTLTAARSGSRILYESVDFMAADVGLRIALPLVP